MSRGFLLSVASFLMVCAGCGGGGGNNGGGGGGGTPPAQVPTLNSIAPSSANAGSPSVTLTLYGSNFEQGAIVEWNGANLSATWVSNTTLTATIPAADLASTGNAQVLVSNSGTISASKTFTVSAAPALATWVRSVSAITNPQQMVFDSAHGKLYVSISSTDPSAPNTIVPVDPVAGTAGSPVPAGNGPDLLSISSDNSYLWVALDGDSAIQRFLLPGLTKDISVPIPASSSGQKLQANSLQAARVNPHTMAIVPRDSNGVYVFDDATLRPNFVPGPSSGSGPNVDWIEWGANDSVLYGEPELSTLNVDGSGVTWTKPAYSSGIGPGPSTFDPMSGLLYWSTWTFDPVANTQAGIYGGGGQTGIGVDGGCAASAVIPSLDRFYCLLEATYVDSRLLVFDQKSYDFLGMYDLGNAIATQPGVTQYLVPFGNAGLAVLAPSSSGNGGLFLIDGAAVNPNVAPDFTTGSTVASPIASLANVSPQGAAAGGPDVTLTITGSGFTRSSLVYSDYGYFQGLALPTTYVSPNQLMATLPAAATTAVAPLIISVWDDFAGRQSSNSLVFTVYSNSGNTQVIGVNVSGLSLGWDSSTSLLYVGTSFYDPLHPNSVVAINPTSGVMVASAPIPPEPILMDISPDDSRLFLGYAGSTTLSELSLPGLNSLLTWPLIHPDGEGPFFAGDLKAAPDSPPTAAVTLFVDSSSPVAEGGVVIFDDNVARPDFAPGWVETGNPGALYDTLAWSNSNSTLAAAENEGDPTMLQPFYTLNVSTSGVVYGASFQAFNASGAEIHSDFGTGLIYSDDGMVASPFDGTIKGSYGASGLVTPDSSTQRVYILGQTAAQEGSYNYTLQSFNESTFAPVATITLPTLTGIPFRMLRWGSSGLAVLVFNSAANIVQGPQTMLYIVEDTSFVSNKQPALSTPDIGERVQARWPRMTARQIASKQAMARSRK